jgi:hypothetical protein
MITSTICLNWLIGFSKKPIALRGVLTNAMAMTIFRGAQKTALPMLRLTAEIPDTV